ncbi:MAG: CopD family protein [Pararhodobacter sp.]|nr:CopD family protein [Pararhodobacter sp.]
MIAILKFVHIASLALWCAGLLALPVLLHQYGRTAAARTQTGFSRLRHLTHFSYVAVLSPAAVVTIAAGTGLIFLIEVVDPWLLAKLLMVAGMALVHAWLGHLTSRIGHGDGGYRLPPPLLGLVLALPLIATVLWLVLAKPDLAPWLDRLPALLREPQDRELPPGVVPI